jgi:Fe-S-cluster containining protein
MPRPVLPQIVPSETCFVCEVCCRFPEPESFLRPYFTAEEIRAATARGIDPAHFPVRDGCQVSVVPNPSGEGYLCPAFDPVTSHCRIYEARPLDCRIYPLAIMWSSGGGEVVLGWDTKCPFLKPGNRRWAIGNGPGDKASVPSPITHYPSPFPPPPSPIAHDPLPDLRAYADRIADKLERDDMLDVFVQHPRLIGRFQDDVIALRSLPKLTVRLRHRPLPHHPSPITGLLPLTLADRHRLESACAAVDTPLAHYAFALHYIWRHLLAYRWTEVDGHFCLFAESPDGLFMPLPPLPAAAGTRQWVIGNGPGDKTYPLSPAVLAACFALMREHNRGSAVSRIENVPEEWVPGCEAAGYEVRPKDPDYLYRTQDLVDLSGDRYKSQRAACNQLVRTSAAQYAPYRSADADACLDLYRIWRDQKDTCALDAAARLLLADSESAHREAFLHYDALGLTGRVVLINGAVRAYTFGYFRSASVFCVLLEVADRSVPGLAQWLFRELCREAAGLGASFINTMDDSGLPSLAQSKQAYHPIRLVPSYIATVPPFA